MVGIHNLHPEGMAYSSGDDESRVVLLFESPGMNEVVMDAPLSGMTGMRYCQIVRELKKKGEKVGIFDWSEFCKNNATVINALPDFTKESYDRKVVKATQKENIDSIARLILPRHEVLLCFGKCACSVADRLGDKLRPKSVLKCWHISSVNDHCSDFLEHSKTNPLWKYQLKVITEYIGNFAGRTGVFGWKSIEDSAPKCRPCFWVHKGKKTSAPSWMKGMEGDAK